MQGLPCLENRKHGIRQKIHVLVPHGNLTTCPVYGAWSRSRAVTGLWETSYRKLLCPVVQRLHQVLAHFLLVLAFSAPAHQDLRRMLSNFRNLTPLDKGRPHKSEMDIDKQFQGDVYE